MTYDDESGLFSDLWAVSSDIFFGIVLLIFFKDCVEWFMEGVRIVFFFSDLWSVSSDFLIWIKFIDFFLKDCVYWLTEWVRIVIMG